MKSYININFDTYKASTDQVFWSRPHTWHLLALVAFLVNKKQTSFPDSFNNLTINNGRFKCRTIYPQWNGFWELYRKFPSHSNLTTWEFVLIINAGVKRSAGFPDPSKHLTLSKVLRNCLLLPVIGSNNTCCVIISEHRQQQWQQLQMFSAVMLQVYKVGSYLALFSHRCSPGPH